MILVGDARAIPLPDASVAAVVTDNPYELAFMGKRWDQAGVAFGPATWAEVLRVLVPGGRLIAFGAPRTAHRIWCAIEDAGFVIEDTAMWLYGSGFPKHGSKLKPAYEPICIARKGPVSVLNIDGCRIASEGVWKRPHPDDPAPRMGVAYAQDKWTKEKMSAGASESGSPAGRWPANVLLSHHKDCREVGTRRVRSGTHIGHNTAGREKMPGLYSGGLPETGQDRGYADADGTETVTAWECHPDCPVRLLDEQSGTLTSGKPLGVAFKDKNGRGTYGAFTGEYLHSGFGDTGGASRFFYTAKASRSEREFGLEGIPEQRGASEVFDPRFRDGVGDNRMANVRNPHPTVKPLALMRYLVRLVTQPGQLVLDPFTGSGTTGVACIEEGRRFIGIELNPEYAAIARRRIYAAQPTLFGEGAA